MSNDIFADLLKGTAVGVASSDSNANSNLSLNQKMNASMNSSMSNGKSSNGALDLDFLDNYVSSSQQNINSGLKLNTKQSTATSDLDDFLLFSGSNSQSSSTNANSTVNATTNNYNKIKNPPLLSDINLLDDFFGQPIVNSNDVTLKSTSSSCNTPDKYPSPKSEQKNVTNKANNYQELKDAALAELLEMGFSLEKANAALESTKTGYDLNGAISFLMEQAHSSTRQNRKLSSNVRSNRREENEPTEKNVDEFSKIVNDLSSAASFLFNSGKKKIQEGVDMYRQQKIENNDNQPLWMKNQLKYKANSMKLPNQDEEDHEEMDRETMKILIQKQRSREQRLKEERGRNYDLISSNTTEPSSKVSNKERIPITPQRKLPIADRSSHLSLSTPNSSEEVYKSASRHRSSNKTNFKVSNLQNEVPPLIETSTIPANKISKSSIPSFKVPPLDSAQTMVFQSSRGIAQEKFKSGDYTSALENYLSATNVIPPDHPLQIIINSNLALVYSKLGNPKEQLVVATKGLDLISNSTFNCPISALSDITIDDNKNLKSFWMKLMIKRAESLEFLEKWKGAKEAYEKLIGEGDSSKAVMDGKNRCMKMLNPRSNEAAKPKPQSKSKFPTQAMNPPRRSTPSQKSETLKNVQQSNQKKEKEDEEKFNLHDAVEAKLDNWRMGNKDNIRALLCSLEKILWPGLNWKPIQLTDLVLDKKVKIYYMKAVAKTHPDKINNNESVENKMIANGVFITLNEAWETFKQSKGM